jgi:hypothetical protein
MSSHRVRFFGARLTSSPVSISHLLNHKKLARFRHEKIALFLVKRGSLNWELNACFDCEGSACETQTNNK